MLRLIVPNIALFVCVCFVGGRFSPVYFKVKPPYCDSCPRWWTPPPPGGSNPRGDLMGNYGEMRDNKVNSSPEKKETLRYVRFGRPLPSDPPLPGLKKTIGGCFRWHKSSNTIANGVAYARPWSCTRGNNLLLAINISSCVTTTSNLGPAAVLVSSCSKLWLSLYFGSQVASGQDYGLVWFTVNISWILLGDQNQKRKNSGFPKTNSIFDYP